MKIKLEILEKNLPGYATRFLSGEYKRNEMPLLEAWYERVFAYNQDFSNVVLVACQHLLEPQLKMFQYFINLGVLAKNILILPKAYSANLVIIQEMKILGCVVFESAMEFNVSESFDSFHQQQCNAICEFTKNHLKESNTLIVLDDGGTLLETFAKRWEEFPLIYGVEQTSSGKNKLLKKPLPFLVNSVASSVEKLSIETDYIIRHSFNRIEEYFIENNIEKSIQILIIGKGAIGKTMSYKLQEHGYTCDEYDILDGKMKTHFGIYDVIIGATGFNSLPSEKLQELKKGCHLISISSSDREFPAIGIRKNSISGINIHDTFIHRENDICLANGGFPITFKGMYYECDPVEMDVTIMKLSEAIFEYLLKRKAPNESVNDVFAEKMLTKNYPLISIASGLILIVSLLKIGILGFFSESWLCITTIFILLILASIPAIKQLVYWMKLEKTMKKSLCHI